MSYWDSSALVKLYVQELDSAEFRELAVKTSRVATGSLTRHEVRTVFRRREAEGVLPSGEAAALYDELTADIAAADIVIQPETADMRQRAAVSAVRRLRSDMLCDSEPTLLYGSVCNVEVTN
jgi:predicted nucleic acid-binding protein